MTPVWRRLLRLVALERGRVGLAVALQTLSVLAGVGLMGTGAWLLSKAALHPSIAALQVAIVGVRAFRIGRARFRYLERLLTHDITLRLLARLKVAVYRSLVPLAPARLVDHRSGDLLGRVVEDVVTLENLYARVLVPSLAAVLVTFLVGLVLLPFLPSLAAAAVGGLVVTGSVFPWLSARLGSRPGQSLVADRGALSARLVDGVQGGGELLAFGAEERHLRTLETLGRRVVAAQARLVRASALGGALAGLGADLTVVAVLSRRVATRPLRREPAPRSRSARRDRGTERLREVDARARPPALLGCAGGDGARYAWTACWARSTRASLPGSASRARACRAASGSGSRSPALSCDRRLCSCSTSPPRTSTPRPRARSSPRSCARETGGRRFS